jgi:hypothetical protein
LKSKKWTSEKLLAEWNNRKIPKRGIKGKNKDSIQKKMDTMKTIAEVVNTVTQMNKADKKPKTDFIKPTSPVQGNSDTLRKNPNPTKVIEVKQPNIKTLPDDKVLESKNNDILTKNVISI